MVQDEPNNTTGQTTAAWQRSVKGYLKVGNVRKKAEKICFITEIGIDYLHTSVSTAGETTLSIRRKPGSEHTKSNTQIQYDILKRVRIGTVTVAFL